MKIEITNEPLKLTFVNVNKGDIFQDLNRNILIKSELIYDGNNNKSYNCVNLKSGDYFYINDFEEVFALTGKLSVEYL